jgi:hypothetical protein
MTSFLKNHAVFSYALVAFLISVPLLRPGYILTLDMVFTPKLAAPGSLSSSYIWQELLHLLNFVLPSQIIEKLIIFTILSLCGLGMHRLIRVKSSWPKYFAGIFYMINPFTYERWMAGQYLVVAGYALLPFLIASILSLCMKPELRKVIPIVLWYSAIATVSPQNLVLGSLLGAFILTAYLLVNPSKEAHYRRYVLQATAVIVGGALLLNSYWLIGIVDGHSPISQTIGAISSVDFKAFATASNPRVGLFFNVLSMYGFWLERYRRYAMPNHDLVIWFGGFAVIAALSIAGVMSQFKKHIPLAYCLALTTIIGFVLALGIYAPITGSVVFWIINNIPLMRGFREPEKCTALLVIGYVYFASYGLDWLLVRLRSWSAAKLEFVSGCALALPLLYTSTMLFGFANQLKPVNYPTAWYSFNGQLQKHPPTGSVLFLPWHEYMSYDFSPRIIGNPAPGFFTNAKIISGTNAQFGGVNDPHPTTTSHFIEGQVLAHTSQDDLGKSLAKINVQYVLVAHGYDYNNYGWVQHQTDVKLLSNQPGLEVFVNEAYHRGR